MSDQARIAEILRCAGILLPNDYTRSWDYNRALNELAAQIDAVVHPHIDTMEQLDALTRGSVVMTMSPRLIPGQVLWIRADDDADGHWWQIGSDDSFLSKDVLYGNPEYARVLWTPEVDR